MSRSLLRAFAVLIATAVALRRRSASKAAGSCAARCVPGDTAHCTSIPPLIVTRTGRSMPGTSTGTVSGERSYCRTRRRKVAPMSGYPVAFIVIGVPPEGVTVPLPPCASQRECTSCTAELRPAVTPVREAESASLLMSRKRGTATAAVVVSNHHRFHRSTGSRFDEVRRHPVLLPSGHDLGEQPLSAPPSDVAR